MIIRCLTVCLLIQASFGAHKIRYEKFESRKRSQNDIYTFLSLIDPSYNIANTNYDSDLDDPPPFTTPRPTPTLTDDRNLMTGSSTKLTDYCQLSRGQFRYDPDCHKFVNCWDGQAYLGDCSPSSLVFEPESGQCVWNWDDRVKGLCESQTTDNVQSVVIEASLKTDFDMPYCADFKHLGYECVEEFLCFNGEIRNISDVNIIEYVLDLRSGMDRFQPEGKFSPWMKICKGRRSQICCKNPNFKHHKLQEAVKDEKSFSKANPLCPNDFTGPQPYPQDCTKFANCWKGHPTIQSCAPGTHFNSKLGQCDFPHKANCQTVTSPWSSQIAKSSTGLSSSIAFPTPPSGQQIRLRSGKAPYSGYLEIFHGGTWGYACDSGTWTMQEANIVCKQLGFERGVRSTTQGLVHGPVNENRKLTEKIDCSGHERRTEKCLIEYSFGRFSGVPCKLEEGIVAVTCIHDSFASCLPGEVPWGNSCYSVHFEKSSFREAQQSCRKNGKVLAEITSQQENDLLSELLMQSQMSPTLLSQVWTGGIGTGPARSPRFYWHGTRNTIDGFRPWWPGWNGERKGTDMIFGREPLGIKMSRKFEFFSSRTRENRLSDYYFWALENLSTRLAFVCERKQTEIGCIVGKGENYQGLANRGESGDECLPWNSPQLSFVLDDDKIANLGPLQGNNYCRNPDGDSAPWCIAPNGEFDYCDIPSCHNVLNDTVSIFDNIVFGSTGMKQCSSDQFQCDIDECVLSVYVCDGHQDCQNGKDEQGCDRQSFYDFHKNGNKRLDVKYVERWLDTSKKSCASHCEKARGYKCRSFNYHAAKRLCTLNELNVGMSGKLKTDRQWDYYELRSEAKQCQRPEWTCPNGKCLSEKELCDGKDDCGDRFDEQGCALKPDLKIRLVGGRNPWEGRVEVKAFHYPYGGICDDGFNMNEANVICNELGFSRGAKEAKINSHFGSGSGGILLDELECQGDENSLLDCKFAPWTEHDCTNNEWAGVVCKNDQQECHQDEEWRCSSGECIPLDYLCDGNQDCSDGSDEVNDGLCNEEVQVRLADGNNATSGRVEVKYKGVWGTICDDNFGEEEGAVICRMLGFEGKAVIHSEAAFSPGKGPIWIQNVACNGKERSLRECEVPSWKPTYLCKHLEDVGVECIPFKTIHQPSTHSNQGHDHVHDAGTLGNRIGAETTCGKAYVQETPPVPVARIAGGMQTQPGSNPWAASIRLQGTDRSFHWCGAVILSEFYVLTVAHCMEDYPKDVYRVRVGDWDMQVPDIQEQEFKIQAVHYHEEYNVGVYLNNDIALVHLKAKSGGHGIVFGDRVVPACLPYVNIAYGPHLNCSVSGWGSTGISKPGYTRYLQAIQIPLLDTQQCISPNVYGPNKLSSGMYCAGYLDGGIDTCQGDSGGAMLCEVRGSQAIMGLTSWGYGCGKPNRPGVYTKVADYIDWIERKMH